MRRSALRAVPPVLALALATSPGCGDDGPDCAALAAETPTLVIGGTSSGLDEFVDLADGDDLKVIINAKGLFALPPSLRIGGLHPGEPDRIGGDDDPEVAIRAYLGERQVGGTDVSTEDGTMLDAVPRYGFTPGASGAERIAVPVIFLDGVEPLDYLNQTVTLEATVADACGRSAGDQLDVVAFWQY